MDNTKESPTILSICTGIRGIERGIERVVGAVRIAAYVEIEAFACWNLVAAMESGILDPAPIWTDVKTFPSSEFHGRIHGIIGGYPCQPFSNAGKRKGEEDPRHLWPFIEDQINTIKPVWCFFENVSGHLTLGFESVKNSLEEMGYRVEAGIYSAEEVGAPHRRERLFILAMDDANIDGMRGWLSKTQTGEENSDKTTSPGGELAYSNSKDAGGRNSEISDQAATVEGETQGENGERMRAVFATGNKVVPDSCGQRLEKWRKQSTWEKQPTSERGYCSEFPSGPGKCQHDWEAPRTTQPQLGGDANGNQNGIDILHINKVYEIYTAKKTGAIKKLSELWSAIDKEKDKWTPRRLWCFLEKEILFSELYGSIQNSRFSIAISRHKNISNIQKIGMRDMWINRFIGSTSQGQKFIKQLKREFADVMCVLSYQITLARRQETKNGGQNETLQYLWENYQDAWWDVPETLSSVQEIWRSVCEKTEWRQQIEEAYKGYRLELFGNVYGYNFREDLLRALGNGVVEQTAELAFRDLLRKHMTL